MSLPHIDPMKLSLQGFRDALAGAAKAATTDWLKRCAKCYIEFEQYEEAAIIQKELEARK